VVATEKSEKSEKKRAFKPSLSGQSSSNSMRPLKSLSRVRCHNRSRVGCKTQKVMSLVDVA